MIIEVAFHSVNMMYHIYQFVYVESYMHPRNKCHRMMVCDPLVLFARVLVEDFCIHTPQEFWPAILRSCLMSCFVWAYYQSNVGFRKWM